MSLTCNGEAPQISQDRDLRLSLYAPIQNLQYFDACARIRGISRHALMVRLLELIGTDQLVGSILDDEGEIKMRRKGEHRYPERV